MIFYPSQPRHFLSVPVTVANLNDCCFNLAEGEEAELQRRSPELTVKGPILSFLKGPKIALTPRLQLLAEFNTIPSPVYPNA
jgi:hypothetical protein